MKLRFGLLCACLSSITTAVSSDPLVPDRGWSRETADELDATPIIIVRTEFRHGQLCATAAYQLLGNKTTTAIVGRRDSHGEFWASLAYEVAGDDRKWRRISELSMPEKPIAMRFDTDHPNAFLRLYMEPFRSSIGKFKLARVILSDGETANVILEDLLPPYDSRDASGDYKEEITDPEATRFDSLLTLVSFTSLADHLFGNFVFIGRKGTFIDVEEKSDHDGQLQASVTCQCSNTDRDWKTFGAAHDDGTKTIVRLSGGGRLVPIRISLDPIRECKGRFKYARVVFGGSQAFSVFELSEVPSLKAAIP